MAIATNAFQTYQSIGNREDLTDVINNISPVDTWFTSKTRDVEATAVLHEWQTDALAAATANACIEGDDSVAATAVTPTTRVTNYCQILKKTYLITGTQEKVKKAGRASEIAYQTEKNLKELALDIEYAMLINSSAVSGASGTARQLCGLAGWLTTNITTGTGTGNEALTETMYNDNLALVWASGGKPQYTLCGSFQKSLIDAFTGNGTRFINMTQAQIQNSVETYKSSYGLMAIQLHHIINTSLPGTIFNLGDMKLFRKAWLRRVKKETLAKTGDAEKMHVLGELTLECGQEAGHGRIYQLTTS